MRSGSSITTTSAGNDAELASDLVVHKGVGDGFEGQAFGRVGEDDRGQRLAVEVTVPSLHARPEALEHRPLAVATGFDHPAGHLVGVDDGRAPGGERLPHR